MAENTANMLNDDQVAMVSNDQVAMVSNDQVAMVSDAELDEVSGGRICAYSLRGQSGSGSLIKKCPVCGSLVEPAHWIQHESTCTGHVVQA